MNGQVNRRAGLLVAGLLVLAPPLFAGAKTDVLVLRNGDRVTCEIQDLKEGRLRVKTDDLGTINIDWQGVVRLTSPSIQEIQMASGARHYGSLVAASRDGALAVTTLDVPDEIEIRDVVFLRPIESGFWRRFGGSLDIGASYTQANQLLQLTPSFSTTYTARAYSTGVDLDWTLTRQEGSADSDHKDLTLRYNRFLRGRWTAFGRMTGQHNTELGLDLRAELAGGMGRFLVSASHTLFYVGGGLAGSKERPLDGESTSNLDAVLIMQWRRFTYRFPNTDFDLSLLVYPGLSQWGRWRGDANLSWKREIFNDFTVGLRVYDSFDNRPVTEGASQNDWGATFSLGWTF